MNQTLALTLSRRSGVMLALLALLLQALALPVSDRHRLASDLWESASVTITICTAHGLQALKVGGDGQPRPQQLQDCLKCPLCLAVGMAFALSAAVPFSAPSFSALPRLMTGRGIITPDWRHLWPPAHGPPA